jgi:hypothetical protein
MTGIEHNARAGYKDATVVGILTSYSSFLFVRLTATLDADNPEHTVDAKMDHSKVLGMFHKDVSALNMDQRLSVMHLLCGLLLPTTCKWSKEVRGSTHDQSSYHCPPMSISFSTGCNKEMY